MLCLFPFADNLRLLLQLLRGKSESVGIAGRCPKLVIGHLFFRQRRMVEKIAPRQKFYAFYAFTLIKVDDFGGAILRFGKRADIHGPLRRIVFVDLRRGARRFFRNAVVFLVFGNASFKILYRRIGSLGIMAPIIIAPTALVFGKLPCDKGLRGVRIFGKGKAPVVFKKNRLFLFRSHVPSPLMECRSFFASVSYGKMSRYCPRFQGDKEFIPLPPKPGPGSRINTGFFRLIS